MPLVEELEDIEAERILSQTRHKELLGQMKMLIAALQNQKQPEFDNGADKIIASIEKLVQKLPKASSQQKIDIPAPIVNIESNNDGIVESFQHIANQITQELNSLKVLIQPKPVRWEFVFERNFLNLVTKVTADAIF